MSEKFATREDRVKIFQDTMAWCETDPALSFSINQAKKNTWVFSEDSYPAFDASGEREEEISVSSDRSFQAAMRLSREYPGSRIAVMNFANAFHPGGGVTRGSSAQEEALCRCSTLYPLLNRKYLQETYYQYHKELNTPRASDRMIYTEGVVICKTDDSFPERMPQSDWVKVDVMTLAAPDLRARSNMHAALVGNGTCMSQAELFGYHVKRAIHMLAVAAHKGADVLVLGAFGCGAFQNDPETVARAYRVALQEFPKVFRRVEFAVYCSPADDTNYRVFRRILG